MAISEDIQQLPFPGRHILMFCGDTLKFSLVLSFDENGMAWLRNNCGHAAIARDENIREVERELPPLAEDWFDIPMKRVDRRRFEIEIPMCNIGHFEAKCFFLKDGDDEPIWPEGSNVTINVEPAENCCGNIIYNAFVRQFGANKIKRVFPAPSSENHIQALDRSGYTVIPPSGTFRDFIAELDFITGELGCRFIHLLPVHPTPTTYARMGRFGSPYAALSFTAIDPALAEFDPGATPLEQFLELVDAVHERNAGIIIDIAINHTGWAASLHESHPHWLVRDEKGQIEVPGAWGVQWSDLTRLDYRCRDLWQYMADIFLKWCRRGVDGFRCDAGYMIPVDAWKYLVARVRQQFPETIFFLEGLGGPVDATHDILNKANFNWAYSELFQNYNRSQIENYLPDVIAASEADGIMIHFAETHDNPRLAARSETYARMRVGLCALCSSCGGFGFANGVEWFAREKINVHESSALNWGAADNQVAYIRRLNLLLKNHPAFFDQSELQLIQADEGNYVVLYRYHRPSGKKVLVVVNLDDQNPTQASWDWPPAIDVSAVSIDLITEEEIDIDTSGEKAVCMLEPGRVLCLSDDRSDLERFKNKNGYDFSLPEHVRKKRLRAKVLDVWQFYHGISDVSGWDIDAAADQLAVSPLEYCRSVNPFSQEPRVITWRWPEDLNREVMIPPGHFLLVCSDTAFRAAIIDPSVKDHPVVRHEGSLSCTDGSFFVLFSPLAVPESHQGYRLNLSVYQPGGARHVEAPLLQLANPQTITVQKVFKRSELLHHCRMLLGTNGRGGVLRTSLCWGELYSRYDALLAANLSAEFPENRRIMFTRCRAWVVFQGYSRELCLDCLDSFCFDYGSRGHWRFRVPTGQGEHILLCVEIEMVSDQNAVRLHFFRCPAENYKDRLSDAKPVSLILRPDIEDRDFHETTKAFTLPEKRWQEAVKSRADGFVFGPESDHQLHIEISDGTFAAEPEWYYLVHRPTDAERGLDPHSDLFSPGYFSVQLKGGDTVALFARVTQKEDSGRVSRAPFEAYPYSMMVTAGAGSRKEAWKFDEALYHMLDSFVVKRGKLKTVIAGYPWFLDWGRDALIFSRGLIAAGKTEAAKAILKQFGRFEKDGTLPNMIQGDNAHNRDTSDAPLWFFVACSDLTAYEGHDDFLDERCGGRRIREILFSMGRKLIDGMPNGIRVDPESGLIFSPTHYTWMDTNYPAGTPRQGYPIEIQALWYAALDFLGRIDKRDVSIEWRNMAEKVQASIARLFWLEDKGWLSDCLHARSDESARKAHPDDALRPNQLLAITMGAVSDDTLCRRILQSCETLLVPGGIRSLADRDVVFPLEIIHDGKLLNDPRHPYAGHYTGDEDTRRKPAYHNGTAWTWLFPVYSEAWGKTYGKVAGKTALAWLASSSCGIDRGCVGHVPEIVDGDVPHTQRGCDAQAWGASELLRVWLKLSRR